MKRFLYLITKAKSAYYSGVLSKKIILFSRNTFQRYFFIPVAYFFTSKVFKMNNMKKGYSDHRSSKSVNSLSNENIKRIIKAYRLSKESQKNAPQYFKIRGLWEEWIKVNYKEVIIALEAEDVDSLRNIFNNLFREQCGIGTGGYDEFIRYKSFLGKFYIKYVWNSYIKKLINIDFDLNELHFPLIGNPCGIPFNNKIIPIEALRHAYRASEINSLSRDLKKPKIVEIGGGLGGLAFQLLNLERNKNKNFILFDIPEVLALSSFFLMSSFPEKKVILFGEENISFINSNDFDIAILPHFSINSLEKNSVDIFYNSCSFSEMDKESASAYLNIIEKSSRKYFMHDNHDSKFIFSYPDKSSSENIIGSDLIPNKYLFKRIYKKPRVHGLPEDKPFIHFEYLYEKIN